MTYLRSFLRCEHGFSLVEMALVLAIIGTIAGLGLPIAVRTLEHNRIQTTHQHLSALKDTIGLYVAHTHIMPCPSPSPDDGIVGQCTKGPISIHKGYIPFKTLGIPKSATLDGFGHPIHMAVDLNAAVQKHNFKAPAPSRLSVTDEYHRPLVTSDSHENVALVLFSEGTAFAQPPEALERINMNSTPTYIDAPTSSAIPHYHRHLLVWSTFNHLFFLHGRGERPKETIFQSSQNTDTIPEDSDDPFSE